MPFLARCLSRVAPFFLCLACYFPALSFSAPQQQQAVLVLSTDNYTYPFFFTLFHAFDDTLKQGLNESYALYPENLDLNRLSTQAHRDALHALLREKYRHTEIKAIVAIGNGALKYLLESGPTLWPNIPVVFVTVSDSTMRQIKLPPNITGLTIGYSLTHTVELAKSLRPETRRIALIGNAPEYDNYRPYSTDELASQYDKVEFIDLRGKPVEEVRKSAAALPDDTVIYYTGISDDGTGRKFIPLDVLKSLAPVANQPILIDNEIHLGSGALGGMVFDPATQGRDAARLVQRLLQGEKIAAMPVTRSMPHPVFDWRQLERWHASRDRLPPNSEIRFYEAGIWEQYRWQILALAAVILLQSLLMAALLIERRRRSRAERKSGRHLAEIAHMNRTSTATFFSATLAHELNQPLAAILSNAEAAEIFLQSDPPAIKEVREILADICRDDRRASDLIQRMRELLKKSDSVEEAVDLNDIVKQTLRFLASVAKTRGVTLAAYLSYQHLMVFADPVQLQQVLINLIINSMDAMSGMRDAPRMISVRTAVLGTSAELCISVSGPGFGDNLGHIFESFFTTKPQGMGLGLSITAEIIRSHGGQIRAENNPDGGATVRFTLPLHKDDN